MLVNYAYLIEMMPLEYRNLVGTFSHSIDKVVILSSICYFKYVGHDWKVLVNWGLLFSSIGLFISLFLPDSPQFHYDNQDYDQARV